VRFNKGTIRMLFLTEPNRLKVLTGKDPCAHDLHRGRDRYPEATD
jgi:hypothetical protein